MTLHSRTSLVLRLFNTGAVDGGNDEQLTVGANAQAAGIRTFHMTGDDGDLIAPYIQLQLLHTQNGHLDLRVVLKLTLLLVVLVTMF